MNDKLSTIDEFLNAAAARQPAPGGGAVAALVGALAASMGEMVLNYSVEKKDLAAFAGENREALAKLTRARSVLLELLVEDQAAFEAFTAAKKNGLDTAALAQTCAGVPLAMGTTALAILGIANDVVSRSNRWLLSDLAVCGELSMATIRCAVHNVGANLASIDSDACRRQLQDDCRKMLGRGIVQVRALMSAIAARTGE